MAVAVASVWMRGGSGNKDLSLQLCPPTILLVKSYCMNFIEITAFGKLAGILVL